MVSSQLQQSAHKRDELTNGQAAIETGGECADSQTPPAVTHVPAGRAHILVVEDDPLIRSMLADLLSDTGYSTTEFNTGVEALACADRGRCPVRPGAAECGLAR